MGNIEKDMEKDMENKDMKKEDACDMKKEASVTIDSTYVLAEKLVETLRKMNWKITTVESCTGGGISARIIDVAGASDVLEEAFVTYCDRAKHELVGVRKKTLKKHTAVSRQTAKQMAEGGAKRAKADICLAATGIAGPGGTEEFPAGLVYLACSVHGETEVRKFNFTGTRNNVREQAVYEALKMALDHLTHA